MIDLNDKFPLELKPKLVLELKLKLGIGVIRRINEVFI